MSVKPGLERAFELARSGEISDLGQLRKALHREGYAAEHYLVGPVLLKSLASTIKIAAEETQDPV